MMSAYVNAWLFRTDNQLPTDSQSKLQISLLFSGHHRHYYLNPVCTKVSGTESFVKLQANLVSESSPQPKELENGVKDPPSRLWLLCIFGWHSPFFLRYLVSVKILSCKFLLTVAVSFAFHITCKSQGLITFYALFQLLLTVPGYLILLPWQDLSDSKN